MKTTFLILFLQLTALCCSAQDGLAPAPAAAAPQMAKNIAVTPATLSFNLDKGGKSSQSVTIRNGSETKQQLSLDFVDWSRDTVGRHVHLAPGTSAQSCASWITLDRPFVELEPGQSTTVTITMSVPDNEPAVAEMKWTMLLVKIIREKIAPAKDAKTQAMINTNMGMGIHIYQTPPNVTNKEVKMLAFTALSEKNSYRISCKNVGGVQLSCKFYLELASNTTGEKTKLESKIVPLFPQQNRFVDFALPAGLAKGKYTAVAMIDANDDDVPIEAAEKEITVN